MKYVPVLVCLLVASGSLFSCEYTRQALFPNATKKDRMLADAFGRRSLANLFTRPCEDPYVAFAEANVLLLDQLARGQIQKYKPDNSYKIALSADPSAPGTKNDFHYGSAHKRIGPCTHSFELDVLRIGSDFAVKRTLTAIVDYSKTSGWTLTHGN